MPLDGLDLNKNGINDYEEFEQDCSCLTSSGIAVNTDGDSPYIEYTDADGTVHQYPANYGLTECMAWDMTLPPSCEGGEDDPDWCGDSWCYINHVTCYDNILKSSYFPDSGLWYSYAACAPDEEDDMSADDMMADAEDMMADAE